MRKENFLERNPNNLQKLLLILDLASIFLILTLSGYGIYSNSSARVLRGAEEEAVRLAQVMVSQQYNILFSQGEDNIALNEIDRHTFDQQTKKFLHPFDIVKIKVFDLNRVIIYSTDPNIIGMKVNYNKRLERAFNGEIDSQQETKDEVFDLVEEQLMDVDVVETYLPVYNASGQIAGSFELYLDVTRYRDEISHQVSSSLLILTSILLFVFMLSFFVVRMGTRQLKALLNRLHKLAVTDPLTGAFNRGELLHRAEQELTRMERRDSRKSFPTLGVILLDLDHFKSINDTHGHLAGDEVLREMANRINQSLREYDTLGRYGGEEFLVLIPDCNFTEAMMAAERIRKCISAKPFIFKEKKLDITASFGVTYCFDSKENFDEALHRADSALYEAKEGGRNKAVGIENEKNTVISNA